MDRNQTGNLLIGLGVLAGLGAVAYWMWNGGGFDLSPARSPAPSPAKPGPTYSRENALKAFALRR